MYLCVCMHPSVCICMDGFVCSYVYICIYINYYECVYVFMYVFMCAYHCITVCNYVHGWGVCVYVYICMCVSSLRMTMNMAAANFIMLVCTHICIYLCLPCIDIASAIIAFV